ncbi:MAG TPA: TerB family tellurite resistance protein [Candidatus Polarisedimenticolia bacterium]|nr:TerB family tellurite resistance protein [Candidatus Polarisedimenticolia bacterium]
MSIWDHFTRLGGAPGPPADASPSDADSIRRIARELDQLDPRQARHLASFAFVLSRVAAADLSVSDEETRAMERIIMEQAGLPEEQAVLVVEIARHQNMLFGGTENFLVTRELKASASPEEKEGLLRCLFAVGAADDAISGAEEGIIAQIASELGVDRRDMVRIRSEFRGHRAVFRRPGAP